MNNKAFEKAEKVYKATPEYKDWKRAEKAKEETENEELLWPIVKRWLEKHDKIKE